VLCVLLFLGVPLVSVLLGARVSLLTVAAFGCGVTGVLLHRRRRQRPGGRWPRS
jgi:hypothetical protein